MLDIIETSQTFIFTYLRNWFPNSTDDQITIMALGVLCLYMIMLYAYRCIYKPHTRKDLVNATSLMKIFHEEEHEIHVAERVHLHKQISELQNQVNKYKSQQETSGATNQYQRERLISTLASDLDGYDKVAEQADRILLAID